jgi:hypothetical protein
MLVEDVPRALRTQLGPDATAGLLALFETTRHEWAAEVTSVTLDRFEQRLSTEIARARCGIVEEVHATGATIRDEASESAATLRQEIGALRTDLIKWWLFFWVSQAVTTAVIVGAIVALR